MSVPFLIDVMGQFGPDQLRVRWRDEWPSPDAGLNALVARTWEEQLTASRQSGRLLFNGRLVRYLRHHVTDGVFAIEAESTDFANFLATNLLNWPRGDELGWERFSNPVGSSALPITADGRLLLGRRGQRVIFYAGYVHVIGGGLEAADCREDGTVDAFAAARRELREELALTPEEIGEVVCLGMVRDPTIRQPELIFDAHLRLTWDEVAARLDPNDPHQEHTRLLALPDEPNAILPFIRANGPVTPVAVGLLCFHGRVRFGEAWYAEALRALSV